MARSQSATKAEANGLPRVIDGASGGVPRGLAVAAAITWRVLLLAFAAIAVGYVAGKLLLPGSP
jgi:hypothetical protein